MLLLGLSLHLVMLRGAETAPADVQRLLYRNDGLVVDLGVGLWAWPLPMDYDRDGDMDLVVSCPDVPSNGIYFFENPGPADPWNVLPVFKPPVRLGPGRANITVSHVAGRPRVLLPGEELPRFLEGDVTTTSRIYPESNIHRESRRVRANQWSYVDYDGDHVLDLVVGVGDWSDYGWDKAFDSRGRWTNGPLHGFVYVIRNEGSNERPRYAKPVKLEAGGKPVDVFGMPSPNLADFDLDGDLDLLCGEFLDGFTYFQNIGSRTAPVYAPGRPLMHRRWPLKMPLCMIVPVAVDWDQDGDIDLVVGQEDGRVALLENTRAVVSGLPQFREPRFFQQQAHAVKFGALVTPVAFDWDQDGDQDLICGNTAGEIAFIENLDGQCPPRWAAPRLLYEANLRPVRIMAGPNGSIQGPAEAKWGYTTLSVEDWDMDGAPDLIVNSIWGRVVWFRNIGRQGHPMLALARPVRVAWPGPPPKPAWNWWSPRPHELVTQWRTTPLAVDWDRDGLTDLVMLDHEGYLAFYRRVKRKDGLWLLPGQRIFHGGTIDNRGNVSGQPSDLLRLNAGNAGRSGRRKLCLVDWDGDGRRDLLINTASVDWLRNVGETNGHVFFQHAGPLIRRRLAGHSTSPTTVDWDRNGVPDLLVGAEDGFLYYLHRGNQPSPNR